MRAPCSISSCCRSFDLEDVDGNHSYASFLSQHLLRSRSTRFGDFGSPSPPHLARALDLLRARIAYLPTPVAQRRLVNGCLMFLNILVSHHGRGGPGDLEEPFELALEDTMEMIVSSICMPLRTAHLLGVAKAARAGNGRRLTGIRAGRAYPREHWRVLRIA